MEYIPKENIESIKLLCFKTICSYTPLDEWATSPIQRFICSNLLFYFYKLFHKCYFHFILCLCKTFTWLQSQILEMVHSEKSSYKLIVKFNSIFFSSYHNVFWRLSVAMHRIFLISLNTYITLFIYTVPLVDFWVVSRLLL